VKLVHLKPYLKNKDAADAIEKSAEHYKPLVRLLNEVFTKKLDQVDSIPSDATNWTVKRALADGKMGAYKELLTILNVEE